MQKSRAHVTFWVQRKTLTVSQRKSSNIEIKLQRLSFENKQTNQTIPKGRRNFLVRSELQGQFWGTFFNFARFAESGKFLITTSCNKFKI